MPPPRGTTLTLGALLASAPGSCLAGLHLRPPLHIGSAGWPITAFQRLLGPNSECQCVGLLVSPAALLFLCLLLLGATAPSGSCHGRVQAVGEGGAEGGAWPLRHSHSNHDSPRVSLTGLSFLPKTQGGSPGAVTRGPQPAGACLGLFARHFLSTSLTCQECGTRSPGPLTLASPAAGFTCSRDTCRAQTSLVVMGTQALS